MDTGLDITAQDFDAAAAFDDRRRAGNADRILRIGRRRYELVAPGAMAVHAPWNRSQMPSQRGSSSTHTPSRKWVQSNQSASSPHPPPAQDGQRAGGV